jgi:hypothetical protein
LLLLLLLHCIDVQREAFDDRVCQKLVGDLAGLLNVGWSGELDLDSLTDPHGQHLGHPEPGQRGGDSLTLGIKNLGFQHDVHHDAGHWHSSQVGAPHLAEAHPALFDEHTEPTGRCDAADHRLFNDCQTLSAATRADAYDCSMNLAQPRRTEQ